MNHTVGAIESSSQLEGRIKSAEKQIGVTGTINSLKMSSVPQKSMDASGIEITPDYAITDHHGGQCR